MNSTTPIMDVDGKPIQTKRARRLVKNYIKKYGIDINSDVENLAIWFDINLIKKVIKTEKGKVVSGVRIYFGAYSPNAFKAEKRNKNTVVLVPTEELPNGKHKDILESPSAKPEKPDRDETGQVVEANEGQACPPREGSELLDILDEPELP